MILQIITKPNECKIIEYMLTLTFNELKNTISDTQHIILSSSNKSHYINDLYPGYKYNLTLTPKTINGPLNSSSIYSFTTLITGIYLSFSQLKY